MNCVLVGFGEIGQGIFEVFSKHHVIATVDPDKHMDGRLKSYELMLVAIPYSKKFVDIVKEYQKQFNPTATIIFSTVPIGTTSTIKNAVHCPIEGKHPVLKHSIMQWNFRMGGYNEIAYEFFRKSGIYPIVSSHPDHTEALKLLSTSYYGTMIEFARYANEVCKYIGMDFAEVYLYNDDYNKLYDSLGLSIYKRPVIFPPHGNIGGHCVVPNAKLLDKQYPSVFLKEIYRDKEE